MPQVAKPVAVIRDSLPKIKEISIPALVDHLSSLTPREEQIVRMRHGFTLGLENSQDSNLDAEKVGRRFCVTSHRINQIDARALLKILERHNKWYHVL